MALASGARVGPYQVLGLLGAGGMGEVYCARDMRLGRQVAVKVLSPASADPDRLRRFEQEARAAGSLNHPNVLAVHDVGSHEGALYLVSELLEGETLRERLRSGGLTVRKAVEYGIQVLRGLAAAHEKGIVHRDLKPENLFLTRDGQVKILDFGLAKLREEHAETGGGAEGETRSWTRPGAVMGSVGYMSPEQVRGLAADARADMFAFGAVLFEMLTGRPAFRRDSAAETMTAILNEDPPVLVAGERAVAPALERLLRRCLEKRPQDRFQSARDLAFALEAIGDVAQATRPLAARRGLARAAFALSAAAVITAAALTLRLLPKAPAPPSFTQLTFRRGAVPIARFAPDGQTVVYSAAWEGGSLEDLGSKNGTRIGPRRIERPTRLEEGDVVAVGPAVLIFRGPYGQGSTKTE